MSEEIQTTEEVTETTEVVTPAISETTETETPQTPEVETPVIETPTQIETPQPDYKEKFKESSKEGILNHARLQQERARNAQLTSKDAPTDDEMRSLYPWWDAPNVDDATRDFYKEQTARDKQLRQTQSLAMTLSEKLEFQEKLDEFIYEPPIEFKGLKGKESEFKRFAKKKDNIGLPLDTLAKAFLFDASDEIETPHTPILTPGLENGTGGPRQAPKPKKLSLEAAKTLRETDNKEYMRLLKAGMIETEEF